MTPGLGLETGGFDGGVATTIYPHFFKKVKFPTAKVIVSKFVHFGLRPQFVDAQC